MSRKAAAAGAAGTPPETQDPIVELLESADSRQDVFQISEYNTHTGRYDYIEQIDIEPVKALGVPEFTRQRYGGGKYTWRVRRRNGKYGKSAVVSVAGEPKPRAVDVSASSTTPAAGGSVNDLVTRIVLLFAGALAPVLVKKLLEGPPPPPDRVEELLKLAGVLRNPDAAANPTMQATAMLGLMREITEFRDELAPKRGGGDRASMVERVVDHLGKPVIDLLERKMAIEERAAERGERRRVASGAAQPSPTTSPTAAADGAETDDATAPEAPLRLEHLLLRIPREARRYLLEKAQGDKAPELYAELTLDALDERTYAALVTEIARPDALDVLLAAVPAYAPYRDWFARFVDAVRASVAEQRTPDAEDAENVATHVVDERSAAAPPGGTAA